MEGSHSFVPLLIVVVLAFTMLLVLSRFRHLSIPVVVGKILVGTLVGDSGLKLVEAGPILGGSRTGHDPRRCGTPAG